MKVAILAGGFGTRMAEYTDSIPKPMVSIGSRPILWHIMNRYANFGHNEFCIALGYKAQIIKEYFLNYQSLSSDFTIDLQSNLLVPHSLEPRDWKVTLADTGQDTLTGGRVKQLKKYIGNETFMLTYGDGLANIDIDALLKFHNKHKKMVTITAVRPVARFGELSLRDEVVTSFKEKPQTKQGWINGGFFVIEPEFFDFIEGDNTILEKDPLEKVAQIGELVAYRHDEFWQCMDTKRDRDQLESMYDSGNAPWEDYQ